MSANIDDMTDINPIKDTAVSPAIGIGALALNFALKYLSINTVQDGTLYQQYKLEGRNMRELHLNSVFEVAIQMEAHLLGTSERLATLVIDAITEGAEAEDAALDPKADRSSPDV